MNNSPKLLVPFLALALFAAPLRAVSQDDTLLDIDISSVEIRDVRDLDKDVEVSVRVAEKKPNTLWKDTSTVTKGALLLASAYMLYPQVKRSYKIFKAGGPGVRKLFKEVSSNAQVVTRLWKNNADIPDLKVKQNMIKTGALTTVYTAGMLTCAGLGLSYIARGLHLPKQVNKSYENFKAATPHARKIVKENLHKAAEKTSVYTAGMLTSAGLGFNYIARSLHLTK
ncbi:hypothetical protein H0X48_05625 [Candidatus Dependentiae bacterium]|nr:hypothetical protein [Candidatus Dependentiae bacterium]